VSSKHAQSAEKIGADALLATGHEAAAHGGEVVCYYYVQLLYIYIYIYIRYVCLLVLVDLCPHTKMQGRRAWC
jgi:NAD(P)H-dependent flavin oxidoreductase YrpB (nitropropane dioxygenase family)